MLYINYINYKSNYYYYKIFKQTLNLFVNWILWIENKKKDNQPLGPI